MHAKACYESTLVECNHWYCALQSEKLVPGTVLQVNVIHNDTNNHSTVFAMSAYDFEGVIIKELESSSQLGVLEDDHVFIILLLSLDV